MRASMAMLFALALAGLAAPAAAQGLGKCTVGLQVTDGEGNTGVITAANRDACLVRYANGQTRGWAAWSLRPAADAPPPEEGAASIVLRPPASPHTLVFHADASGHFAVAATANGAPLQFLVDTGATLVFLTPKDARAAGIASEQLVFDQRANTGGGQVKIARVVLREIRIDNLAVEQVPAAVIESLPQSLLGMSFLERLKSFKVKNGALTITW